MPYKDRNAKLAAQQKHYIANKEAYASRKMEWRQNNPELYREQKARELLARKRRRHLTPQTRAAANDKARNSRRDIEVSERQLSNAKTLLNKLKREIKCLSKTPENCANSSSAP